MNSNDDILIGRIECDMDEDSYEINSASIKGLPKIITRNGKEYTWNEFGRELLTWEGWQFKLQMIDPNDEIE